ncbi:putative leader peptide [Streptomyces sp. RB17]|uniref:putative leader peptide n=1 Tax=Streptomyces sp. RB17 TaxID=2585197 RepID=UPI003A4C71AD
MRRRRRRWAERPGRSRPRQPPAPADPLPVTLRHPLTRRPVTLRPHGDGELTGVDRHAVLRTMTDTCVRLWRRVHMDLVRYAGCVCRPSC